VVISLGRMVKLVDDAAGALLAAEEEGVVDEVDTARLAKPTAGCEGKVQLGAGSAAVNRRELTSLKRYAE
jgi:Iap family predicted aminopeptidase